MREIKNNEKRKAADSKSRPLNQKSGTKTNRPLNRDSLNYGLSSRPGQNRAPSDEERRRIREENFQKAKRVSKIFRTSVIAILGVVVIALVIWVFKSCTTSEAPANSDPTPTVSQSATPTPTPTPTPMAVLFIPPVALSLVGMVISLSVPIAPPPPPPPPTPTPATLSPTAVLFLLKANGKCQEMGILLSIKTMPLQHQVEPTPATPTA